METTLFDMQESQLVKIKKKGSILPSLHRQLPFKRVHRCSAVFVLHLATTELKPITTAPQQYCSKKKKSLPCYRICHDVLSSLLHSSLLRVVKLRLNSIHSHSPVKDVLSFNFSTGCSCSSFPAALCVGVKGSLWTSTPLAYESAPSQAAGPTACQPLGGVSEFSLLNGTDKANPSVH